MDDDTVRIERRWAMPNGKTFTIKPIRDVVRDECLDAQARANGEAVIIDPFAREAQYGTITNDLNPEYSTDFHMDALEFLRQQESEGADLVLYDPPYSMTQAAQLYKSYGKDKLEVNVSNMAYWARCKDECARVLKPGGVALCCGWNTNGLGRNRGFVLERVVIVPHGGEEHDDFGGSAARYFSRCRGRDELVAYMSALTSVDGNVLYIGGVPS